MEVLMIKSKLYHISERKSNYFFLEECFLYGLHVSNSDPC